MSKYIDFDTNLVVDSWGNPDVAYYEAQARKMRSDYIVSGILKGLSALKAHLKHWFSAPAHTRDA